VASHHARISSESTYFCLAAPRVLAHRGLALEVPENTLLAFAHATATGVRYVETDVHDTRDGVSVIAHDPTLNRVASRAGRVDQLTMNELRHVDLGNGAAFCSLAEALDAFPDMRFNIDVKAAGAIEPTVEAILKTKAVNRVLIGSFSEKRRAATVRALPGVATSASALPFARALVSGKLGLVPLVRASLRGCGAVQIPERAMGLNTTTQMMIHRLHAAGVEVHVWTINDPVRMRELLDMGVDGLVTDRADLALRVVNGFSAES
jgi:glycerophosphoryl diester phosphodiesterase